ncbi:hypothetical protein KP509_09G094300 [Ceratopteris richardii]|uniref:Subtilisin-like protease n=1 Tax=Ceratopteris richardii TaxID=49495 RepID=A0A8T2U3I0_CERRI|nr:hypothetical protein KP509_09G094300 [Ceratopteris richardii]
MRRARVYCITSSACCLAMVAIVLAAQSSRKGKTYIVRVDSSTRPTPLASVSSWYAFLIASAKGLELNDYQDVADGPIYSYDTTFKGFAVVLTEFQAEALRSTPGVASVQEDRKVHLQTTRTPEFMGLNHVYELHPASDAVDNDVIIGLLDTGIWPESKSFSDDHMSRPVPERWRGECESAPDFNASTACNRKLIGARAMSRGYQVAEGPINETLEFVNSPRDIAGHGTHTASTAAGSYVKNASLFGYAGGTASGVAAYARLAVYKVLWGEGSVGYESDVAAAFEQAIIDGVDIISLSIAHCLSLPYDMDTSALSTFKAVEHGIVVSAAGGNSGPEPYTVCNPHPWTITVGASTIDREFPALIVLGNGASYIGTSIHSGADLAGDAKVPLVLGSQASHPDTYPEDAMYCLPDVLNADVLKGKIVVCNEGILDPVTKGMALREMGALGMVIMDSTSSPQKFSPSINVFPTVAVTVEIGDAIKEYISTHKFGYSSPTATIISKGTAVGAKPAPIVVPFSGRGPNPVSPIVPKPDLVAPGVAVLAAWPEDLPPSSLPDDERRVNFHLLSGTSMACPHVSGIAALLKSAHPDWSPAAIKSALMTTAYTYDNAGNHILDTAYSLQMSATSLAYGNGQVNPVHAIDPGLVYDIEAIDYLNFLCGLKNLTEGNPPLDLFLHLDVPACPTEEALLHPGNLNYPAFSFVYNQSGIQHTNASRFNSSVIRTVTNVGSNSSVYKVTVKEPPGVTIKVEPETLNFTASYEKKTYTVSCQAAAKAGLDTKLGVGITEYHSFGELVWSDTIHTVRSSISFIWTVKVLGVDL